ncbi:PAS domain-containing methyl-accepting chemotaxis protein [Vreelandella rituensis]|uniref:PAS domain S-box protein n=1 Tax=Vreelandella rituensis TaxID=2282306 RepID=A0A368U4N7_9GAMM|nr:PAS domain-containing methyl-accepting chemotaxis protein [Halomonas rituensis]RCV92068.1 PAS domain S-box protein [Halomonas rituensis]
MLHHQNKNTSSQEIQDDDVLISKTDLKSKITHANQRFIEVSGYSNEELHGSPHNIVRHPDMPGIVFADMWKDLLEGKYWTGLVKNRRKDGTHYWVRANVVPVRENGQVTGFVSIRVKPEPEAVKEAENVYRSIRNNEHRYRVKHGTAYRSSLWHRLINTFTRSDNRHAHAVAVSFAIALTVGALGGFAATQASSSMHAWLSLGAGIVLGLIVSLHSWFNHLRLHQLMRHATDFSLQLAAGNLAVQPLTTRGSIQHTLSSMGFMRQSLEALISNISQRVGVVRPSVEKLLESNEAMAIRIEQQASAVQQTAASTEQISSTVAQSAENAQLASQASLNNVEEVDHANRVIQQLSNSMEKIARHTENMAGMVSTIDNIAFQTNILALNASVEAARAGEHGRGFAVVAQEVRKLAEQSAHAAQQVQQLITQAQEGVHGGRENATEAEQVMHTIREASHRVNDLMGEISAASQEQSQGISQISQAITEIDRATQDSAANMQIYITATTSLRSEVNGLAHSTFAFLPDAQLQSAQALLSKPPVINDKQNSIETPNRSHALLPAHKQPETSWETF